MVKFQKREKLVKVERREVQKVVYASGYVEPEDYLVIKSEVSGRVEKLLVREGDRVKKGQLMAVLSHEDLVAAEKELLQRLKLVEERLKEDSSYLTALKSRVDDARIQVDQTERELRRREELASKGLIPSEQLEKYRTAYERAVHLLREAEASYRDTVESLRRERNILRYQLQRVREDIDKRFVRSPVDGLVLKRFVSEGSYVNHLSQDNKLFAVSGSQKNQVLLELDEDYAGLVKEGQKVLLTLDAFPGKVWQGVVYKVEPLVDRSRRVMTVKVKAQLPENVPVHASVSAQILVERKYALLIPAYAYKDGKVIKYEKVRKVELPVKVGNNYDGYLEVLEGLKEGDLLVVPP